MGKPFIYNLYPLELSLSHSKVSLSSVCDNFDTQHSTVSKNGSLMITKRPKRVVAKPKCS